MKFKDINELAYEGNMGVVEMFQFYRVATQAQKNEMAKIVKSGTWEDYKKIIYNVLGVKLV